jgi:hypothetical protein
MNNIIIEESNDRYKLIIDDKDKEKHSVFWKMPDIAKLKRYFSSKPIKDVENLEWHLDNTRDIYGSTVGMLRDIIRQIKYLESRNLGFLYLSPDDIIVYYNTFFIVNTANLYTLTESESPLLKKLEITVPYTVEDQHRRFLSPEVDGNEELPVTFKHTCAYYSVGQLVQTLLAKYDFKYTPLAYFVRRAIRDDNTMRRLHFI